MPLKTPQFWYRPAGIKAYALLPIAWLYQIGHRINQRFKPAPYETSIPVICIGNAVAGGSGKTPTAIALMALIKEAGFHKAPYFLTRGYGGETDAPRLVNAEKDKAGQVGDEPLLLARSAPTIVAKNRADGAKLAEQQGADLIVMDDGLQNQSIKKDISFLVIDRAVNFGNGKTIPAGPLREPLSKVLPKSDVVICIGRPLVSDKPVFEAEILTDKFDDTLKYIAFAGLGRPQKFLDTLEENKATIVGWHAFADHHLYSEYEIHEMLKEATEKKAHLITTEKDYMRLPKDLKNNIKTLPITLNFKDKKAIVDLMCEKLG